MNAPVQSPVVDTPPLALEGDLTIQVAAERCSELLEKLCSHLAALEDAPAPEAGAQPCLGVDLSALADIDSAGVQLLIAARRLCESRGVALRIGARSKSLADALDTFRLDDTLHSRPGPAPRARRAEGAPA